jgi:beta-N-acetylhexosaminidase
VAARAFICGLRGHALVEDERSFLADAQPWGAILFKRNIEHSEQVRRLCDEVRDALGRNAPILIDQEGGRVQRIGPHIGARLIALDLLGLGIDVDCLPILDVPVEGGTDAIGNRALGRHADAVATIGGAQMDGLLRGGVLPVIKHLPGHGRAKVDSHLELPRADAPVSELEAQDFLPFRLLARRAVLGMTCHLVFSAVDEHMPATLSAPVIANIIRERIGFDGALMTDDISMKALSGGFRERTEGAIRAGCDLVLHCNGDMAEMSEVAAGAPELHGDALRRTDTALALRRPPEPADREAIEARFDAILAGAVAA